jgi:hypothetical protein
MPDFSSLVFVCRKMHSPAPWDGHLSWRSVTPPRSTSPANLDRARLILDRTHAFADPNEADAAGFGLILPTPDLLAESH